MYYVIWNTSQRKFVADMRMSRDGGSFTRRLQEAKVFRSKESAEADRCPGNEIVKRVDSFFEGRLP